MRRWRSRGRSRRRGWLIGALLMLGLLGPARAAALTVAGSRADDVGPLRVSPEQLKPDACGGITVHTVVLGGTGTNGNDLILGTAASDWLDGLAGDDCLVAGSSLDVLFGGDGDDVLIGGPGFDLCFGGAGADVYVQCELRLGPIGRRPPGPRPWRGRALPPGWAQRLEALWGPSPSPTPVAP